MRAHDFLTAVSYALLAYCVVLSLQMGCLPPREPALVLAPVEHRETLSDVKERPDAGVRLGVPLKPEPFQKTPPCDAEMGEVAINGACYGEMARRPPCGKLREHDGRCYRPIAKDRPPTSIAP